MMECLTTEVLCLHIQHELDAQTQQDVEAHLRTCQSCTDRLSTMQEHDTMLRSVLGRSQARQVRGQDCCSAEELSAYANGLLTPQETVQCEQHLDTCDFCLGEVMAMRRMQRLLKGAAVLTPPANVVAAARREFARAEQPSVLEKLGSLIIQVATDGLKFVEALLLPEDVRLAINGYPLPAAAFRGAPAATEAVALLDIQQAGRDLALHIQVLHEDQETVLVKIQVRKQGEPWARRQVTLVSAGRTLYARNTSSSGEVEFPRLAPGEYTFRLPQEHVETQLVLRST
jgi:anti-sigma factor RsiW